MAKEKNKVNIDDDFDFGADDFNFDITTPAKPKNKREVIADLATETIKATASKTAAIYRAAAPSKTEIFQSGKAGQRVAFNCWVGESIVVPNL